MLELHDLTINAHAINEHLVGQPFRLKKGRIRALRVTICYEKILSESFTVCLEGVELDFVPAGSETDTPSSSRGSTPIPPPSQPPPSSLKDTNPSSVSSNSGSGSSSSTSNISSQRLGPWSRSAETGFLPPPGSGVPYELRGAGMEDGDELDIIAEWIQLIKARIKVSVRDLKIRLHDSDEPSGGGDGGGGPLPPPTCVCISLYSAMYYDKTPDHFASGGKGLSASTNLGSASSAGSTTTSSGSQAFAAGPISHKVSVRAPQDAWWW